ncbi:uncharacterized protein LOC103312279 [Tribolium castaneum]|uniref:Uncharacterized protein n=1 Tax=Tribolium castaneum TaxID=7070 RepID=D6W6H8_TRICA|nr:PREDICTED: uncharacterized protein LOC103312279 [Tribolium castaneum]EFA11059.2 hypothetical protein TcasGA2_TC004653 [Tribolium castaneum]|eukprot:XP_008190750.2 PREDICTED: uncharacterized protein LOC103312279 [Tribolium castaneum]
MIVSFEIYDDKDIFSLFFPQIVPSENLNLAGGESVTMLSSSSVKFFVVVFFVDLSLAKATNYPLATTVQPTETSTKSRYEQGLEDYDEAQAREGRGMMEYDDHDPHDHDHDMQEQKAVKDDPWSGYYDFIINEGSFKFWAAFQLVTALLLVYSAFAAVYYAKFNVITTDYDYYDGFFGRSNQESSSSSLWSGLSAQTFQRIFDALSSKKYS